MLLVRLLVPVIFLTPSQVLCLQRYYGVTPTADGIVVAGEHIPYDDGRKKSADEKLEHPDVEDAFTPRYRTGPIARVTSPCSWLTALVEPAERIASAVMLN